MTSGVTPSLQPRVMTERTKEKFKWLGSIVQHIRKRLDIYNTVILSIATVAITWCTFQSAQWNGIQDFKLAEANIINRKAQQKSLLSGQQRLWDEQVMISFMHSVLDGRRQIADYYLKHVRPEMANVFSDWMMTRPLDDSNLDITPLNLDGYKQMVDREKREESELVSQSDRIYAEARHANSNSDNYALFTVMFSMILFMGGVATKVSGGGISLSLIVISAVICVIILLVLFFSMPVAHK